MTWYYDRYICNCCGHFVKFESDDNITHCPRCGVPVEVKPGRISYKVIAKRLLKEPNRTVDKNEIERALGVKF